MIEITEIPFCEADSFFAIQIIYLVQDGIISDSEDIEYFRGEEYRSAIKSHMQRFTDRHRLIYFCRDKDKIGAASYCVYESEKKSFLLDFWIFPQYRNCGLGSKCYELLEQSIRENGAEHIEINCDGRQDRLRFWKRMGFVPNGRDEYGVPLLIKKL